MCAFFLSIKSICEGEALMAAASVAAAAASKRLRVARGDDEDDLDEGPNDAVSELNHCTQVHPPQPDKKI